MIEDLVFLPGLDGTGISFEPLGACIPASVRATVVRYPQERLSFAQTVAAAAEQMPSRSPSLVVAESFSGPVAIELVASGRLAPRGLVLAATFARAPGHLPPGLARLVPLELLFRLPVPAGWMRRMLGGVRHEGHLLPLWTRIQAEAPPEILAHRLRMIMEVDVRDRLPAVRVPCCYLQASDDLLVPPSAVEDFVAGLPNLTVRRLEGPHFILQTQPCLSWGAMEELVAGACGGAA